MAAEWCWDILVPSLEMGGQSPDLGPCSALVLGFRGAHRKQEEQRRKLEKQMTQMETRQAEELARLEAMAGALRRPQLHSPPPPLGETLL